MSNWKMSWFIFVLQKFQFHHLNFHLQKTSEKKGGLSNNVAKNDKKFMRWRPVLIGVEARRLLREPHEPKIHFWRECPTKIS